VCAFNWSLEAAKNTDRSADKIARVIPSTKKNGASMHRFSPENT
jgi:hypothetical protein